MKPRPHAFEPDEDLSREWVTTDRRQHGLGPRQWCRWCHLPGEPGDTRHLEARRLGERERSHA